MVPERAAVLDPGPDRTRRLVGARRHLRRGLGQRSAGGAWTDVLWSDHQSCCGRLVSLARTALCGRGLRAAGALIVFGSALHIAWLLVPAFDVQAGVIVVACAAVAALALISLLIGSALGRALEMEASHAQ